MGLIDFGGILGVALVLIFAVYYYVRKPAA